MDLREFVSQIDSRSFPLVWPGQWVDGRWLPVKRGAVSKGSHNPNTGELLMEVHSDKDSVGLAVEAAYRSRREFGALPMHRRLELLARFRRILADYQQPAEMVLRIEAGKPAWEAHEDMGAALNYLDWVVTHGPEIHESLLAPARLGPHAGGALELMPLGVTAAYLPFSTPLTAFVFYVAAAVIAGCPLILNSSSHALLSSLFYALLAKEAELPGPLLNVVFGNFNSFKQLLADKRVAAILYTGSREHCDTIRQESRPHVGRQVVLQSGGKNAVIVHESADLPHAVRCVVYGALKSAGQRCTSTSRVFVHRSRSVEFRDALAAAFSHVRVGRTDRDGAGGGAASGPFMGPLYSAKAVEKYLRFQTMANRESEKTLLWGKVVDGEAGYFVTPSLHYLGRFDNGTAYQGNVLFSPDVAVYDYEAIETAIEQINTTDASFAVSFLGDPEVIQARRSLFLAPNLLVNTPTVEIEATLPLGGRLQSGHHRFHGPGIALYLCYPQVVSRDAGAESLIRAWPWPGF
jgi:acyl-CoA reductase-like NAD-dependent aldehyde dehydrogenase